jgi:hypothetical protein
MRKLISIVVINTFLINLIFGQIDSSCNFALLRDSSSKFEGYILISNMGNDVWEKTDFVFWNIFNEAYSWQIDCEKSCFYIVIFEFSGSSGGREIKQQFKCIDLNSFQEIIDFTIYDNQAFNKYKEVAIQGEEIVFFDCGVETKVPLTEVTNEMLSCFFSK